MRQHHRLPDYRHHHNRTNTLQQAPPASWGSQPHPAGSIGSLIPPWTQSQPFRPPILQQHPQPMHIIPEERYEPMVIVHETVSLQSPLSSSYFCGNCQCPMEIRIRLEPCFHVVCLDCFPSIVARNDSCPICNVTCTLVMPLHPNDVVHECSGTCFPNPVARGKVFLNNRSLKCHEMLFHVEEAAELLFNNGIPFDDTTAALNSDDQECVPESNKAMADSQQGFHPSSIPVPYQNTPSEATMLLSTVVVDDSQPASLPQGAAVPEESAISRAPTPSIEGSSSSTMQHMIPSSTTTTTAAAATTQWPPFSPQSTTCHLQQEFTHLTIQPDYCPQNQQPFVTPSISHQEVPIVNSSTYQTSALGNEGLGGVLGGISSDDDELEDLL